MDSVWTKPSFWASLCAVGVAMAVLSAIVQSQTDEKEVKSKAVLRDGILGAIFTTIVWVLSPETMTTLTTTASSVVNEVSTATTAIAAKAEAVASELDVQVGPAKF